MQDAPLLLVLDEGRDVRLQDSGSGCRPHGLGSSDQCPWSLVCGAQCTGLRSMGYSFWGVLCTVYGPQVNGIQCTECGIEDAPLLLVLDEGRDVRRRCAPRRVRRHLPMIGSGLLGSTDFHWGGSARAENAQGTPTQSHISPSILQNTRIKVQVFVRVGSWGLGVTVQGLRFRIQG